MTYTGKWTCDKCEHTSDNEHDPCNCDDDCCTHVETIASLRSQLTTAQRELAEARAEVERLTKQNDVLGMLAAQDHQARDKIRTNWVNEEREWFAERDRLTAERDEARGEVERLREQMMHKAQHLLDTVYREQWQRDTAEAIAAWLEAERDKALAESESADRTLDEQGNVAQNAHAFNWAARQLRAGAWRGKEGT